MRNHDAKRFVIGAVIVLPRDCCTACKRLEFTNPKTPITISKAPFALTSLVRNPDISNNLFLQTKFR